MAKTYKIEGYLVDANGDDCNLAYIKEILHRSVDLFGNLNVTVSPDWEWDDDCPENKEGCSDEEYERRFKEEV